MDYIAAIAPRGVVAVALAKFAGEALGKELGGPELAALVFLTVALTIGVQPTYAAPLARRLEVQAMRALVARAGTIARRVGAQLSAGGFDVVLADPDGSAVTAARGEGLQAELGDAADVKLMERLCAREAEMAVAATNSDETNLLFSQYVLAENPGASSRASHRAAPSRRSAAPASTPSARARRSPRR